MDLDQVMQLAGNPRARRLLRFGWAHILTSVSRSGPPSTRAKYRPLNDDLS
jgi:hypothetical protein